MKKIIIGITSVVVLGASFLAGNLYSNQKLINLHKKHPFLAKRIFSEDANDSVINFEPLRKKLQNELSHYNDTDRSLYFEYLPTGTSIRIGENSQLVGASLLKLPHIMNLYHLAEAKSINLEDKVQLRQSWLDDSYGDLYKKGSGYELTIRDLVKMAAEKSDNTAINGIKEIVASHKLLREDTAINALDVDLSTGPEGDTQLSSRSYSSFLKCLYFACYVSPDNSQEILSYLSANITANDRLPKYLPKDLKVAHKFGVSGEVTQGDCGIIYVERRNYVLCVLLNENKVKGSEIIAQLSKYVYDYVSKQ